MAMCYLFDAEVLPFFKSLSFTKTLYAFDFDGTLAPIVENPTLAKMNVQTVKLLESLNECADIAILSGRSIDDIKKRFPFLPRHLVGNHGVENHFQNERQLADWKKMVDGWQEAFYLCVQKKINDNGVFLENKNYSLAIHYRKSRTKTETKKKILQFLQQLQPAPRLIKGKSVINILPEDGLHKGLALAQLMKKERVRAAVYIGDDDTDEDVFTFPDERIIKIRVGYKRSSQAQYYIKRQTEINRVLKLLIRHHM